MHESNLEGGEPRRIFRWVHAQLEFLRMVAFQDTILRMVLKKLRDSCATSSMAVGLHAWTCFLKTTSYTILFRLFR